MICSKENSTFSVFFFNLAPMISYPCPFPWEPRPGSKSCYYYGIHMLKSWGDARFHCLNMEGDLLRLEDAGEQVHGQYSFTMCITHIVYFLWYLLSLYDMLKSSHNDTRFHCLNREDDLLMLEDTGEQV